MNKRRFTNLLAYFTIAIILVAVIVRFLALKVFFWPQIVIDICYSIALYSSLVITVFSAFVFASTKRNKLYMFFLVLSVIAIVIFMFIL